MWIRLILLTGVISRGTRLIGFYGEYANAVCLFFMCCKHDWELQVLLTH